MSGSAVASGSNYFDGMTKLGKTHKHFLWIAALCYFFDQMDLNLFSYITPVLQTDLGFNLQQIADMNAASFLGMFFGGIIGGLMADRMGRKNALLICVTTFSLASIINGLSAHFLTFITMRFCVGFGVIGMVVIAMVYMAEMLPSATRGKYQALTIASGTIGIPFGAIYANLVIPTGPHGWRLVFFIGGAGILLLPLGFKWLRESPRWLVARGRIADAEKIVSECTNAPCDLSGLVTDCVQSKNVTTTETLKIMFSKFFFKQTMVVIILTVGITMGTFYLSNWGTQFMVNAGWAYGTALMVGAAAAFGGPIGDFSVSFISDKGGRRKPIIIFLLINFVISSANGYFTPLWIDHPLWQSLLGLARAVFTCGCMTMMWTYLAESFPTRIRSNATGLVFATGRLVAAGTAFTVPFVYAALGLFGISVVNGLMYAIPALIALFWGRDSAQKSLEELEAEAEIASC